MSFTHLHVHTEYSLLDGSCKIKELVSRAKELGMDSLAITDHGVMYGAIDFYKACKAEGIKPIIGCEVYVAPHSRLDRESTGGEERYYHLILLAENQKGYENLVKIVSKGFIDGFYYRPRVDKEILRQYSEGIICASACLAGEVARYLVKGLYEEAKKVALEYRDIFGPENYFLEIQDHGIPDQKTVIQGLLRLSQETGIPLIATNDTHYIHDQDWEAHDVLLCIQTGKKVSDENRMRYEGGQYYLKSEEEMSALFPYAKEALENTAKIAQRCNVDIEFGVRKLPKFHVPGNISSEEYLRKLCFEGLERRYPGYGSELKERLEYELGVITSMGFTDYFLIVWDFIKYARDHDIAVGPGRGSAAGSVVAYTLEITNIDPIKYQLLFERFLNPERVSMPDIDVDFCYERRPEVIDYVVETYGREEVVQIVTFGTMAARGVLRDVGRVMDLPYAFCDMLSKMIPTELNITIDKALTMNPELRNAYENDEQAKTLIDMGRKLEGLPRHTSMHAAGVVISQKPVDEYVPLSRGSDGTLTTQYTMTTLEELGLLKMDFLGLRTLTVIQNAVKNIEESQNVHIDIEHIDMDDKDVLHSIGTGKCDGIFQLESTGMKSFMKELKPESLEDIIAGISLYRPGPMDFIPKYIQGKDHPETIVYDCPQLEPILAPTYGCIVYQEQVMQIVRDLAGYTLGRSDLVRRAMSKKKTEVMEKERKNFVFGNLEEGVPGCISNGISEKVANKIYDDMIDFAKYAFNKSHAAAYAVVAYQTAWLKYYYPREFMAALMTSVMDNAGKVAEYIYSCRQMGIEILPPDINQGRGEFSVQDGRIRYGLSAIRSVGRNVVDAIVQERKLHGQYQSVQDFMERLSSKEVNKKTMENLIKAGAFDSFGYTRKQQMLQYPSILEDVNRNKKDSISGQMSLFDTAIMGEELKDSIAVKYPEVGEYDDNTLLSYEKEVLGIYASGHPLQKDEELLSKNTTNLTSDFVVDEETGSARVNDGAKVVIGGLITGKTLKTTKSNQMMAFITIEDLIGSVEVLVFPRDYEKYRELLNLEEKVLVQGRVSIGDDPVGKLILESIVPFSAVPKEIWLQFDNAAQYDEKFQEIAEILKPYDGHDNVVIFLKDTKQYKKLPKSMDVEACESLLYDLKEKLSEKNVKVLQKRIDKFAGMM